MVSCSVHSDFSRDSNDRLGLTSSVLQRGYLIAICASFAAQLPEQTYSNHWRQHTVPHSKLVKRFTYPSTRYDDLIRMTRQPGLAYQEPFTDTSRPQARNKVSKLSRKRFNNPYFATTH